MASALALPEPIAWRSGLCDGRVTCCHGPIAKAIEAARKALTASSLRCGRRPVSVSRSSTRPAKPSQTARPADCPEPGNHLSRNDVWFDSRAWIVTARRH